MMRSKRPLILLSAAAALILVGVAITRKSMARERTTAPSDTGNEVARFSN
jgi:hypothetical protein